MCSRLPTDNHELAKKIEILGKFSFGIASSTLHQFMKAFPRRKMLGRKAIKEQNSVLDSAIMSGIQKF